MRRTRRHGRQPIDAAAARQTQHQRLGLIVALMADQQMQNIMGPAPAGQQAIACRPRGGLQAGTALGIGPVEDMMLDAARRQPVSDLTGFFPRLGPQVVIDGQGNDRSLGGTAPGGGQQGQRHAVAAAGNRHSQPRRALERAERRHGLGKIADQQPCFDRSVVACFFRLSEASGNSLWKRCRAAQASFFLPSCPIDRPTFNRLSATWADFGYF